MVAKQALAGHLKHALGFEREAAHRQRAHDINGGDLGWNGPGTFVPEFDATMNALKDNEMSEPIRTQFGWHLIQVLGRRSFDTTEESMRQRAFQQLRESKADEETELWLRRLRDEAFVDTNL